jgi:cytochrome c oxidase cbb3-type subunit III
MVRDPAAIARLVPLALLAAALAGCGREARALRADPGASVPVRAARVSPLSPGPMRAESTQAAASAPRTSPESTYVETAYNVSQGKQLYEGFNCVGCHSHGGGGMGPPLMDASWRYGSSPDSIFTTIVDGRPNGMPSFGGRIPAAQVWQIVAYVRSMSGLVGKDAASGRDEDMQVKPAENSVEPHPPRRGP